MEDKMLVCDWQTDRMTDWTETQVGTVTVSV